jgi:signal transduction histidine kinase/ActR/RegA family two-component response regulator
MIHQQASAPIRSDVFDDPDVLNDGLWDLLNKGHSWRGIVERESPASQPTTQAITISPLRYQSHTLDRIVVIRRDITELRAAERASENNARLAALGTMAATVGHEINNPLTYVRANIENVIEQLGEIPEAASEDILTSMDDALEGTQRVAEIVKRMLSLARTPIHETENIAKVTPVVTNALAVTRNAIRHRATLQVSIEDDLVVAMRESSLFQVLVNLLQNAGQAIPEGQASGNTVSIRGQRTTDSAGVDWIRIDVSDTGAGISRDISDKIFDPFFTTKDVGKGTGLGLSVCKTLIDQAQGRISILDRQEQGSTFRMELRPAAANLPISLPEAAVPESIASKRILVLDDDPRVGRAVKTILSNHEVITYDKAEEAIHAVRNGVFDLVICDVMMPDINGIQVRDLMLRDRPDLTNRWIFMSGGIFGTALSQDIRESSVPLIDKPIEKEVLLHALRRMFGNETSPQS